jgi:signal peptidase II
MRGFPRLAPGGGGARPKGRFLLLSLAVLVLDQWSKWLIELHLPQHAVQPLLPGLLNLTHVRNTGVAFGLFAAGSARRGSWPLVALGVAALALVLLFFLRTHRRHRRLLGALALIVGGALGNLMDRLANGAVTDFLDLHLGSTHWPAFNVADSAITLGIALLALDVLGEPREAASPASPAAAAVAETPAAMEGSSPR